MNKSIRIKEMLLKGYNYSKITTELRIAPSTVSYYAKKLNLSRGNKPKYDWEEIQKYIKTNNASLRDVCRRFGCSTETMSAAKREGRISHISVKKLNALEYSKTIKGKATPCNRRQLKKRLIKEGTPDKCSSCGLTEWRGQKAPTEIDHIDGNSENNSLENIRILCLHCHSQTPTWRGRNVKKYV